MLALVLVAAPDPLDAIALDGALVSAYATTLDGKPLYERNTAIRVMPASNQKLWSAAFALHSLGPDARQTTRFWKDGNRTIIEANGDPMLTRDDLLAVRKKLGGSDQVDLIQRYAPDIPGGWEHDDLKERYAAPVFAFSVDRAGFELWGENGKPSLRPEGYGVKIERQPGEKLSWSYDPFKRSVTIRGPIPQKATRLDTLAVPEADLAAARILGRTARRGGTVPKREADVTLPGHTTVEVVAACLPPSDNNLAEHLLLNAAAAYGALPEEPYPAATRQMKAFAERIVGVPFNDLQPRDGSGLARQNLVTTRAMVGLLRWANQQPTREVWRKSLAFGGGPGTLKNRLADVGFAGKTGSLSRVAALSGYLTRQDGSEIAVSVIVNHYAATDAEVRAAMDAWVRSLR